MTDRLLTNDVLADLLEATRLTFQEQRADEMSAKATVALLRAVTEAQDAKTAAAMQTELDAGHYVASCPHCGESAKGEQTQIDANWEWNVAYEALREKGQALADAAQQVTNMEQDDPWGDDSPLRNLEAALEAFNQVSPQTT